MSSNDLEYYRTRAAEERRAAQDTSDTDVSAIHEELAGLYDRLVNTLTPANDDAQAA